MEERDGGQVMCDGYSVYLSLARQWPELELRHYWAHVRRDLLETERALRGVVLGRRNHHNSRSKRGTEVAALFYSLLESEKLAGVEPKEYLCRATRAAIEGNEIPLPHQLASAE